MPGKYCTGEEKARIIAWMQENIPIKTICKRTGRAKSTIMKVLSWASGLAYNVVPVHNYVGGRQKKNLNATNCLLKSELKKDPQLTAS